MNALPLLGPYQPEDIIAWHNGKSISCATFLAHVADCLEKLPDKRHVLNLCTDRYRFLVGFAAALLREQITLLPPNRAPKVIEQIGCTYPTCYTLTDGDERVDGLETVSLNQLYSHKGPSVTNPVIPGHHIAAIAFTSGSTGVPRPNSKTWESLVMVAQKTGVRILEKKEEKMNIVATVPHQHMYGLETSIMLPIQYGWSFHSGRPFYPEDIRSALLEIPEKRILVSTPIHIRACLTEHTQLPDLMCILSATAPLSDTLAQEVEKLFQTKIIEIYGFAEVGTIATRRTVTGESWKMLSGLFLSSEANRISVNTPYFSDPIRIPDSITPRGPQQFDLRGRPGNLINIGGHRASMDDLNYQLTEIEGVTDGVFYMPESQKDTVTRLIAFAVAPGKLPEAILSSLRKKIDPVFLPRPLYLVDSLPRNPTGKLPKEVLETLAANQAERHERGKKPSAK
jgi:acyl-coenzyme A synthetase/AMP-(fatty) acid ligase